MGMRRIGYLNHVRNLAHTWSGFCTGQMILLCQYFPCLFISRSDRGHSHNFVPRLLNNFLICIIPLLVACPHSFLYLTFEHLLFPKEIFLCYILEESSEGFHHQAVILKCFTRSQRCSSMIGIMLSICETLGPISSAHTHAHSKTALTICN